jgi:hypothetical protein
MTEQIVIIKNNDGEKKSDFHHPLVLSFLMFLGQFLFMPLKKFGYFSFQATPRFHKRKEKQLSQLGSYFQPLLTLWALVFNS